MKRSRLTTICIGLLVLLAVYQTGQLWFVNITENNFFRSFFSSISGSPANGYSGIVAPYRIITHHGGGRFSVLYNGLGASDAVQYGNGLLAAVLKSGEYKASYPADYGELFDAGLYIYEYPFDMPVDLFARAFGQKPSLLTSRGLHRIRSIIICPPSGDNAKARVLFIDDGHVFAYELGREKSPHAILPIPDGFLYYFIDNRFVPNVPESGLWFSPVSITNPYTTVYGEKQILTIQKKVEHFFNNPSQINAGPSAGGVFTYSGANKIVRYYERDILEYANYQVVDKNVPSNFLRDYETAVQFLRRDTWLTNEWYLAGYRTESQQHTFYFDFAINDMPLIMPEGFPSDMDGNHPIEVTVEREVVLRYKKLAYNFHVDEYRENVGQMSYGRFKELLADEMSAMAQNGEIGNIVAGYKMDYQPPLLLHWFAFGDGWSLYTDMRPY